MLEILAKHASAALFYVFALISAFSALGVMVSKNIVRMAVFLLFTLMGVAGLYFLLSAEFLAAVQLVVYAGGILILIVFGIMLTSREAAARFVPSRIEVIVAVGIAAILLVGLVTGIVMAVAAQQFDDRVLPAGNYPMDKLGQVLLGDFLVPFEIVSVLLLVVMIGAAYLAKGRRRTQENPH